ncbi:MAG: molybdopterin-dependent oxidoreductase [Clostridiales bacterium]|nr:molybdopterin-dependent oxidoreductase [Clostridiales bacterium]
MTLKHVGKSYTRNDGVEKTTGSAKYVADMKFPGMLHAKVLRSPYAHAIIKSIDTTEALKLPGVFVVLTGKDVPGPFGVAVADQYPLAKYKVRYAGEPVAAVVAVNERVAKEALKHIKVEYEPLPFVIHPKDAVADGAPILHEDLMNYNVAPYVYPQGKNIYQHFKVRKGDIEEGFEKADLVVEGETWYPYIHHVQLEPHCAVAQYNLDGTMTMYSTTQAPFVVQNCINMLHDIPLSKIQVIVPYIGGGFGGKSDVTIEPLVSCLAKAVPGRFVRLLLTREEMFIGTNLGRGAYCKYKIGLSKEGKILAMQGESYLGSGGNVDYAVNIVTGMGLAGTGPYEVPNLKLDVYGVYTNTPPIGALRGYGHPEVHFPVERLLEKAARKLGMDPVEFRLKNLLAEGKVNGIGQVVKHDTGNVVLCAEKVAKELYKSPKPNKGDNILVGRGMAAYMKTPCMPTNVQSSVFLKLNADGSVTLATGAIEMGQGTYTVLAQMTAEALDIPYEKVNVTNTVDTLISPYEWQTVASHTTWGTGNAIILAAENLKAKLKESAAKVFNTDAENIKIEGDKVVYNDKVLTWGDLALGYKNPDGSALTEPIMGEGHFVAKGVQNPDPETGQGNAAADWTQGCIGIELGIDKTTGEVHLYRLINYIDAGTIVNPQMARDQVLGAITMVISSALTETLVFSEDTGKIRNNNLVDYKIVGIEDMPEEILIDFVQTPEESGPYGAKGIGEHGTVGTAPAILNAIYDATGIDFYELPVTAEKIMMALEGGE